MKAFLKSIYATPFVRNILTLFTGTALGQIINFGVSIYLTRIYSPEDFGVVSVFLSITAIFLVGSCWRYDVAMVTSKTDDDAHKLFSLSTVVLIGNILLLTVLIIFIYLFDIDFRYKSPECDWLFYLPISVYLPTQAYIFWMWEVRKKRFQIISFIRIVEAIVISGCSILFKSLSALGLLFANFAASLVSSAILSYLIFREFPLKKFLFSIKELKQIALKYSEFPKVNVLQGFNDMFQMNAIPLIGSFFFYSNTIGWYALCMRVLQAPMWLIIKPIATVFLAEASEQYAGGNNLNSLVRKTILQSIIVALPLPLITMIVGPDMFSFVFGSKWYNAGVYARIFSVWLFCDLIRQSVVQVVAVIGKQRQMLYLSLFGNILLLVSIVLGGWLLQDVETIFIIVSFSQAAYTCFLIFFILQITKK